MVKEAYIKGFLYKLATYGINPEDIYGSYRLDDTETADPDNTLGYANTKLDGPDPDNTLGYYNDPRKEMDGYGQAVNINGTMFKPKLPQLLANFIGPIGKFSYNQYRKHKGLPYGITYTRKF